MQTNYKCQVLDRVFYTTTDRFGKPFIDSGFVVRFAEKHDEWVAVCEFKYLILYVPLHRFGEYVFLKKRGSGNGINK